MGGHSIVTFTNTSVPIDPTQFRYDWDFGLDATPATATGVGPFRVDYTSPGPRDVVITATNIAAEKAGLSCSSQFTKNIVIPVVQPTADFKAVPAASCYPSKITVTENNSTQGDIMEWRLIDNNGKAVTSNADLPVFEVNASGKYTLSLKVTVSTTGQVAVAPVQIFTVYDKPRASFDVRPDIVYVPNTELSTFNLSFGASSYFWDFGDNGTSTEFQPAHTYTIEGKYDIKLVAIEDHGDGAVCRDTLVRTVIAKQGGLTKVPNAFTPNPNGPTGGGPSNGINDVFLPIVKGIEEFNMQIYDRWGNLIFESNSATIGWDGYNNEGRLMPAGVYVYKLTVLLSDKQRSTQIGDVTMIR
jgi:gliding motility-associated-like protein